MDKELKPCPFCGETEEIAIGLRMIHGSIVTAQGSCTCGALGPQEETEEEATEAWNRRV